MYDCYGDAQMNEREFALMDQMRDAGAKLADEHAKLKETLATRLRIVANRLRRGADTREDAAARRDRIADTLREEMEP